MRSIAWALALGACFAVGHLAADIVITDTDTDNLTTSASPTLTSLILVPSGGRPTCDVSIRGRIWFSQGALGVVDTLEVCHKTILDAYVWIGLF